MMWFIVRDEIGGAATAMNIVHRRCTGAIPFGGIGIAPFGWFWLVG